MFAADAVGTSGAVASGNVAVPVNPSLQPEEIAYVVNNSQASLLITSADLLPKVAAARERMPALAGAGGRSGGCRPGGKGQLMIQRSPAVPCA